MSAPGIQKNSAAGLEPCCASASDGETSARLLG